MFVQKLCVANGYLELVNEFGKKKRPAKRTSIAPFWLNQAAKIVLRYKFAVK